MWTTIKIDIIAPFSDLFGSEQLFTLNRIQRLMIKCIIFIKKYELITLLKLTMEY